MILRTIGDASNAFGIKVDTYTPISSKTAKIKCKDGICFIIKESELYTNEKYCLLDNLGVNNVLYPLKDKKNRYVSSAQDSLYTISSYIPQETISDEYKIKYLLDEMITLHNNTKYKKVLKKENCRKKMEDLYEYLQYKFNTLEAFVRSVECDEFDENSIMILKNYQYILDAKKIMSKYNKKLVLDIKNNKSVYYAFVHNNPKIDHLLMTSSGNYLISIEQSKMGIPVLDLVKYYLYYESANIDIKQAVEKYLSLYEDEFYANYFYFFVMLYYIKGIIIIEKEYVTSQSFVFAARKLKRFIELFELKS